MNTARMLTGAVLLDLAVSPLFAWDVFTAPLGRDLGVPPTVLAGVFSVGLVAFMTAVLIGGRLADRVAPRRLALIAAAGTVAGLLGSAAATSVTTLIAAFGVLVGGATGLGYVTAVRVAGTVPSSRGLALGLVVSAYALGTAVLAPTAAALLAALGRGRTFVLLAVVLGVLLITAAALVPGRTAPSRSSRRDERTIRPRRRPDPPVVLLWLVFGLGSAPALAAFAQAGHLAGTAGAVVLAVTLLNIGNFVGRLVAGPLSDRWGRSAVLHANSALLVAACLPLALSAAGTVALVALFVLGTQYGALSTLTPAATSDVVCPERFATTYGRIFTGWGLAGLLAPVGAATLATQIGYGGVYQAFLAFAAAAWACVAVYTRLARRHTQSGAAGGTS